METLFLVNLIVFTYFTLYLSDEDSGQDALFYVSSSVVLLSFICILVYHVYAFTGVSALLKKLRRPNEEDRIRLATSGDQYGAIPPQPTHSEL